MLVGLEVQVERVLLFRDFGCLDQLGVLVIQEPMVAEVEAEAEAVLHLVGSASQELEEVEEEEEEEVVVVLVVVVDLQGEVVLAYSYGTMFQAKL